jgi:4a-hydroxytetrahydrobiopterin dehydratase
MWTEIDNKLNRKIVFKDFVNAFGFITKIALISEKLNHHATITNTYNTVELWLCTHDAGNVVTQKDIEMAAEIDKVI